jgi:hypothetical protein
MFDHDLPPIPANPLINWPLHLTHPSPNMLCTLSLARKLYIGAFDLAAALGTLWECHHHGHWCWLLTDRAQIAAETRRIDGETFSGVKSLAIAGSHKNAPCGLVTHNSDLDKVRNILLVEGMPDYFAGLALAIDSPKNFRVATMLGSACRIESDPALLFGPPKSELTGARILIVPHADPPGARAAGNWSRDLYKLGASQAFIQRLPQPFKDLNDALSQPKYDSQKLLNWF